MLSRKDKVSPLEMAKVGSNAAKHQSGNGTAAASPVDRRRKRTITVNSSGELVRDNGLTYLATLLNLLKSLVGAGFLALPLAFSNAGLWTALLLILLFAFLNRFCMAQLVKCAQHHYRQLGLLFLNYGDMAKTTCSTSFPWIRPYSNWAKCVINLTILFLQFGFCSTYYLFVAVSFKEISEELSSFRASMFQWLMLIYLPMVLLNFIRTLRFLALLSTIGNLFMVSSLVFILQFVIRNPQHSIHDLPWYNSFDGMLSASGAIIYSFEAQTLVLPMENKLKRPGQMLGPFGILSTGIFLASLVYSSIGFFGYVAYGSEVKGSLTLNLPQHQVSFTLVKLAICISVFGSFLLQMYVIVEMAWAKLGAKLVERGEGEKDNDLEGKTASLCPLLPAKLKLGAELLFRTLLVTVCFLFAAAVPNLERIIPLVGITSGMLLSFVFPALLDLLTFVPVLLAQGKFCQAKIRLLLDLLLSGVGLFGMFAGLKANLKDMMAEGGAAREHVLQANATLLAFQNGTFL